MTKRKHLYKPAPKTVHLPHICIAEGCTNESLTFSKCCEIHYEDASRWFRTPEERKNWQGLNVTPTFVYFVQAGGAEGHIKIGQTRRGIQQRIADARTFCPLPIEVLACAPTEYWVEKALHTAFVAHHERGEWFRAHPDVLSASELAGRSPRGLELFARPYAKLKPGKGTPKSKLSVLSRSR